MTNLNQSQKLFYSDKTLNEIAKEHEQWLRDSSFCERANLSNEILTNVDLSFLNLEKAIIKNALFTNCKFEKTNFYGADLSGSTFVNCEFSETDLLNAAVYKKAVYKRDKANILQLL